MPEMHQFRSMPARTYQPRINRQALTINDVVAMQTGDAIGHGRTADVKTLRLMAELGNAKGRVNGRFGHPAMSANAMGKRVMNARNFRVVGDKLLQDVQLDPFAQNSPAFARDPIPYLLDRVEHDPANIGMSVVITSDAVWKMEDGEEKSIYDKGMRKRPEGAVNKKPLLRPYKFHFVDVVDEGALTPNGMFGAYSNNESDFALLAFQAIDEWRERFGIELEEMPAKIEALTRTYISLRHEELSMTEPTPKEEGGLLPSIFRRKKAQEPAKADPTPQPNLSLEQLQQQVVALSAQVEKQNQLLAQMIPAVNALSDTTQTMLTDVGNELEAIDAKFEQAFSLISQAQAKANDLSALRPMHPIEGFSPTHQGSVASTAAQFAKEHPNAPKADDGGLASFQQLIYNG